MSGAVLCLGRWVIWGGEVAWGGERFRPGGLASYPRITYVRPSHVLYYYLVLTM